MALAKHTRTGNIVNVPAHYIGHPTLGKNLVAVGSEEKAAPKAVTKKKEQLAPEAKLDLAEPETNIEENEE
jgi:hypothetical protein